MSRLTRIFLWTLAILVGFLCFLLAVRSLLGSLMGVLLVFAIFDYSARRYRNSVRNFNSALRAICHHEGAIEKVARAFSRTGPLSGPCYEYSRRLMQGEDPLAAAVAARVPLELQTAIAMRLPSSQDDDFDQSAEAEGDFAMVDSSMMPAYGQFIYLTVTAVVTCNVLAFMSIFILPTMEKMFEEFGIGKVSHQWMFSSAPAIGILVLMALAGIVIVPLLNRGQIFSFRLPGWIPAMPRLAQRKASLLYGIADGVDAGWPLGKTLALGHAISTRSLERRSLEKAMHLIEQGTDPLEAIRCAGWMEQDDVSWLQGSSPLRAATLLRSIAGQAIRDARANLRWIMALFFPALILMLGLIVSAYAIGFFMSLTRFIRYCA